MLRPFLAAALLLLSALFLSFPGTGTAAPVDRVLHMVWSLQAPYQYLDTRHGGRVTGIDVASVREAADRAGMTVLFRQMEWDEALEAVADGRVHGLLAAFDTPERRSFGHLSEPIRQSEERVFLPEDTAAALDVATSRDLLDALAERRTRVAVVSGYDLGPHFAAFEAAPATRDLVRRTGSLSESLGLLEAGEVDGFVMDRLAGHGALAQHGVSGLAAHPVPLAVDDLHVLFSRAAVDGATVNAFDEALTSLHDDGRLAAIWNRFVLPIMIDLALGGAWFETILTAGMVAFSISAVVIARAGGYGLFGAVVLAALPALGGGVLRDLLILRDPYVFDHPVYVFIVLGTLAAGYLINRLLDLLRGRSLLFFDLVQLLLYLRRLARPRLLLEVFDAAGIAAFTVVAVTIAVESGREPLWLWGPALAAITATAGAILRDMIRADGGNTILRGGFYGETVVLWSLALSLYLDVLGHRSEPAQIFWALMATMLGIFTTRMAFVAFDWKTPRY